MNLADKKDVRDILSQSGFSFKKSLGQNFLIDSTVCPRMAQSVCGSTAGVLEIGPGAGVLTRQLAENAKKVTAIEIDKSLKPVLEKTLEGLDNINVIFGDVMKLDLKKIIEEEFSQCSEVNVCANLPYYITSPVIMLLLQSRLPVKSITVMVQKEAAERICAAVGSRKAGAVTVAVNYYCEAEILFYVPRTAFIPSPNVDSAVISLEIRKSPIVNPKSEEMFFRVVRACFSQRRKTLLNALSNAFPAEKEVLRRVISGSGLEASVRGETLTMEQLCKISDRVGETLGQD